MRPRLAALLVLAIVAPAALASAPGAAQWETLSTMPGARAESTAVAVGARVYVIGGVMSDFLPVVSGTEGRVDVYDAASGVWRRGPPLPVAVNHAVAVAAGERIFVLGGYVGSLFFTPTAATWVLDTSVQLEEQAWRPFVPLPAPRGAHASATDGRTLWVFGGVGAPGPVSLGVPEAFHERTVLALDLEDETPAWRVVGLFPDVRDHLAGAYHDGKVYAVGGRDLQLHRITGRMDVLDVATGAWTEGPPMPTPRAGLGAGVAAGRIVIVGGESATRSFDEAEAFDPTHGAWSALPRMPGPRHGPAAAVVGDALYVAGGGPMPGYAFSDTLFRLRLGG